MKIILFFTSLVSLFILTGCTNNQSVKTLQKTPISDVQSTETGSPKLDISQFSEDEKDGNGNIYTVQFYDSSGKQTDSLENSIKKLVQLNFGTGSTTILIPDIIASAKKIAPTINPYTFSVFSVMPDGHSVFLSEDQGIDGFNVPKPLWRFDTQTNKLIFLKNVSSYAGSPFYTKLSPDKQMLVAARENENLDTTCLGDSRNLYLLNMINDTVKTIVSLPKGQTLNARYCGYSGGGFKIEWLDNASIKYTVFDQGGADKNYENNNIVENKPAITNKVVAF